MYIYSPECMQSGYQRAHAESGYNVTPEGEPADDEHAQILHHEEGATKHLEEKVSRTNCRGGEGALPQSYSFPPYLYECTIFDILFYISAQA